MRSSRSTHHSRPSRNKLFTVETAGTLQAYLLENLKNESRTTVKSLLAHKQVTINDRPTTQYNAPLNPGDEVGIWFDKQTTSFYHPQLHILYEDDHLIVADKASGLLSMGTEREKQKTAYRILNDYVKRVDPRRHIFIVHRLDRETSGVMMFAKDGETQRLLQERWDEAVLERKYVAVVEGQPGQKTGQIKSYIAENSALIVHRANASNGKLAITNYNVLKSNGYFSLMELDLRTGRKNQIRVHMQELGCPVTGDPKYGAKYDPIHRLALHAFKLRFIHPQSHREMSFELPVPDRFRRAVKA